MLINPLFYEALSGEFSPVSDPENKHTLGKLAIATYLKGQLFDTNAFSGVSGFQYEPSWAPGVLATVKAHSIRGGDVITEVAIASRDDHKLSVSATKLEAQMIQPQAHSIECLPLRPGEDLDSARDRIAQAAQNFFEIV